jgi:hypothetical protein
MSELQLTNKELFFLAVEPEVLDSMHCGLFATPKSIPDAFKQIEDMANASSDSFAVWTAVYLALNAFHQEFTKGE